MSQSKQAVNIIRTKLYCPPVPSNYIDRDMLDARLEAGYQLPLNVLASPAGYGKTTLVSHWVQSNDYPCAWLSLDDSDSDVRVFFNYFVAALRTVSAEAGEETLNTINAETLPPLSVIAGVLANDLEDLELRVIMVLDDYHRIREPAIHNVLDSLLAHPPRHLHLVVLSRRDPQLSLASLRARHLCNEIRIRDLEFSSEETASYFERVVRRPLERDIINQLQTITEGWVVGVRLASLALQHQDDIKGFLRDFSVEARPLREYMLMEVLSKLPPGIRDCLLTTSILDRFNASLCDAVCNNEEDGASVVSGKDFIDVAESTGLFCIALDGSRKWFRFHHLFNDLLKQQLIENRSRAGILQLHKKASNWFEQNDYYQEAIQHALAADDVKGAADILDNARHGLMNRDLWYQLELWLKLFPHKSVEQLPHLLVLRCWLDLSHWYRLDALVLDAEKAGALLENADIDSKEVAALKAELSVIRSALAYWTINSELAAYLTDKALGDIPEQQEYVRSVALMYRAGAYQLDGEAQQAALLLRNHYNDEMFNSPGTQARIMQALCFIYWSDADTRKLRQAAKRLLQISLENDLLWSHSFARYFLGLAHYECNELREAREQLEFITVEPYSNPIQNVVHCSFLLGLCYQAQVLSHRAREIADSIAQLTLECGNEMFIDLAEAFQAELDLLQGNSAQADIWVENYKIPPRTPSVPNTRRSTPATQVCFSDNRFQPQYIDQQAAVMTSNENLLQIIEQLSRGLGIPHHY